MADNYHEKFQKLYNKQFAGSQFNNEEFAHHLTNINFHFECGEVSKLSDEALSKIKIKFSFYQYGGRVKGLDSDKDTYADDFRALVNKYGKKYGFKGDNADDGK